MKPSAKAFHKKINSLLPSDFEAFLRFLEADFRLALLLFFVFPVDIFIKFETKLNITICFPSPDQKNWRTANQSCC